MPAKSAKQKRFMTMVKARQHGHKVGGPKVQKAAAGMSAGDVEDFVGSPVQPSRSTTSMKKGLHKA